jgi:hypothetical protein
MRGTQSQ